MCRCGSRFGERSERGCGCAHTQSGLGVVYFRASGDVPMSDDDEIQSEDEESFYGTKGHSHFKMEDAFCARMR